MVREDQIAAPGLNIEADTEPIQRNSSALDVPPGPSGAQH
jgi:hypothetical protein